MNKIVIGLISLLWLVHINAQDYEDVSVSVGINHSFSSISNVFGGGVSFMDFDGDGWDDVTLATALNEEVRFYKNINGSSFTQVTFPGLSDIGQNKQVLWIDIENDGDKDFFVANHDQANRLFENLGNMTFQDITVASGLDLIEESTFGASFGDINNDGFLDLFIMNRNLFNQRNSIFYLNNGDKTFTNLTVSAGVDNIPVGPFCGTFIDYNKDGFLDFFIAEDKYYGNVLFENNGNETFTDMSAPSGFQHPLDAMSVAPGDFDNDDDIDIYVTNTPLEGNHFFGNNGDNTFDTIEIQTNLVVHGFCWGANFLDVENDGDLDLYISAQYTPDSINSSHLFLNNGIGSFNIADPIIPNDTCNSFSNAVGDYNHDGFPDIIVNNYDGTPSRLWKNTNNINNWLKIKLRGTESNIAGYGSKLEVYVNGEKQLRYMYANEGFICQNADHEIFGMGNVTNVDSIVVTWLSGIKDRITDIQANQEILIVEGDHPVGIDNANEIPFLLFTISGNDILKVQFAKAVTEPIELRVIRVNGQQLYAERIRNLNNSYLELDISSLPSGIYILELLINDQFYTEEFFRQ